MTGAQRAGRLRVQLFSVQAPFTAAAPVSSDGRFRFKSLTPGDYTITVVREGLGEVRRTVVVSPSLADAQGVVAAEIPYSAGNAALSETGATISVQRLAVPQNAAQWYGQAREHLARRDSKSAVDLLRRAVEAAPDFADAWNTLGVLAFQRGDLREAEQCYRQGTQADVEAFDSVLNLGALLLRTERAAEALKYNRRAAEMRPGDAGANAQLGMNYFQLGRFGEAEQYLVEAKRLDPAHQAQPQLFLAEIYRQRGDAARAAAELRELLALRPDGAAAATLKEKIAALVSL